MEINLTFHSDTDKSVAPIKLSLAIDKSPFTKKWIEKLTEVIQKRAVLEKNYCLMGFPSSERGLGGIAKDLNASIEVINNYGWNGQYIIKERASEEMSQDDLNKIHHHFENLIGQTWKQAHWFQEAPQEVRIAILSLNQFIHEYESKYRAFKNEKKFWPGRNGSLILCSFSALPRYELEEDDLKHFEIGKNFGDVFLHYSQLGKTFQSAFEDKDEHIHEENITGHRYYTGEFDIYFSEGMDSQELVQYEKDLKKWISSKGFDPLDKKLCLGEFKIGKLKPQGIQKNWSPHQFQMEMAKRPDLRTISINKGLFVRNISCEFPYSPSETFKVMENFFNSGRW